MSGAKTILCADDKVWVVPDDIASASAVLRECADEMFVSAFPLSAVAYAHAAFTSARELPPSDTSFDGILDAIAVCDELQIPIHGTPLYAFNMLLVLETIRSSGAANPYDASSCVLISYALEQTFPRVFRSIRNQADFEMFYWRLVRRDQDPAQMLRDIIGDDPRVRAASSLLRNKCI